MSSAARLQAMMAKACFGKDAPFEADLGAFLASHGVAKEDADALLASPRRLGLYRQLIRHNVTAVIATMLERTRVRCEAHAPGAFDATVDAFLDEVGPKTPHLRDVPGEFLAYAAPKWRAGHASHHGNETPLPRWIAAAAELELVEFTICVAPRPLPLGAELADVSADLPLVFAEPRTLVHLAWAVHELPPSAADATPEERDVTILVYRDPEHRPRFLELTPLAAAILERLFVGDALGPAMVSACAAKSHPLDDEVLAGAARLLADLGERGVLLGARAT